jgi:hypothetical protein
MCVASPPPRCTSAPQASTTASRLKYKAARPAALTRHALSRRRPAVSGTRRRSRVISPIVSAFRPNRRPRAPTVPRRRHCPQRASPARIANAPSDCRSACRPSLSTSATSWRTFVDQEFAPIQTVDDGIVSVSAEGLINFPQLVDHFQPGLVTFGSGGVAAPPGKADRHPHDVFDATMDTAVRSSWTGCCSSASLAEGGLQRLHISPTSHRRPAHHLDAGGLQRVTAALHRDLDVERPPSCLGH